jgi:hypothetical protein
MCVRKSRFFDFKVVANDLVLLLNRFQCLILENEISNIRATYQASEGLVKALPA